MGDQTDKISEYQFYRGRMCIVLSSHFLVCVMMIGSGGD